MGRRRDGSDPGEPRIHYRCGQPFADHEYVPAKGGGVETVCPDDPRWWELRHPGHPFPERPHGLPEDIAYDEEEARWE